jgi:hypothetical protein
MKTFVIPDEPTEWVGSGIGLHLFFEYGRFRVPSPASRREPRNDDKGILRDTTLPASNRLHDLDLVAVVEPVLRVLAARDDLAVDFDGDPALAVAGFREQGGDGGCRLAFARLAVERDLHVVIVASASASSRSGFAESRSHPRDASDRAREGRSGVHGANSRPQKWSAAVGGDHARSQKLTYPLVVAAAVRVLLRWRLRMLLGRWASGGSRRRAFLRLLHGMLTPLALRLLRLLRTHLLHLPLLLQLWSAYRLWLAHPRFALLLLHLRLRRTMPLHLLLLRALLLGGSASLPGLLRPCLLLGLFLPQLLRLRLRPLDARAGRLRGVVGPRLRTRRRLDRLHHRQPPRRRTRLLLIFRCGANGDGSRQRRLLRLVPEPRGWQFASTQRGIAGGLWPRRGRVRRVPRGSRVGVTGDIAGRLHRSRRHVAVRRLRGGGTTSAHGFDGGRA